MSTTQLPTVVATNYLNQLVSYLKAKTGQDPQVVPQSEGGPNATGTQVIVYGQVRNYTRISDGSTFSFDTCSGGTDPYINDSGYMYNEMGPAVGYSVPNVPDISQASPDVQAAFALAYFGAPLSGDRMQALIDAGLWPLGQIPDWLYPTADYIAAATTIDPATLPCIPQGSITAGTSTAA